MKREPVGMAEQNLRKCFRAVFLLVCAADMFLGFVFTANWVAAQVVVPIGKRTPKSVVVTSRDRRVVRI